MCLNTQSSKLINYQSIVMNNLAESISGHRSSAEALASRIFNSNNYIPSNVEDVLVEGVWEPLWNQSMMTEEAQLKLGML